MWKVFLVISAVVLAGSGVISWQNQQLLDRTRIERKQSQDQAEQLANQLESTKEELGKAVAAAAALKDEAQKLQVEVDTAKAKVSENDLMVNNLTTQSDAKKLELADAKKFLTEIGDVKRVQEDMAMVRTQVEKEQIEVASLQQKIAQAIDQKERLTRIAGEFAALKKDQEEGRIRPEFNSSIKRAYNQWGFVVVQGGNDQGVVKRAQLDVSRRGQPICKLIVTSVEPQESIAEVIPGSMIPGQTIQEGDDVTKSSAPTPIPGAAPAAPAGGAAAPELPTAAPEDGGGMAPAAPVADDPFGAPAPAPAPSDDPFGGGMNGGAAPAPAAPAGDDPFGGGAMNGGAAPAPAAPAADDPFGAPATPPADAPKVENDPFK
ncbi:MAG: hypothetical protein KDN20_19740 [Verrucomicrobiae bacterium]|nr:hypothetical protein [Verrucomicrobiae bacterium]